MTHNCSILIQLKITPGDSKTIVSIRFKYMLYFAEELDRSNLKVIVLYFKWLVSDRGEWPLDHR